MLNQVVLIGRIGKDPELRYTPSGVAVASFSLAVNRQFRSQASGEQETDWFNIVAWKQSAEFAANYLGKGRLVAVQGRLQARSWVGQDGAKRYTVEVVAERLTGLDKPKEQTGAPSETGEGAFAGAPGNNESDAEYDPFAEE
jgi:single-strand DNA-binding protein